MAYSLFFSELSIISNVYEPSENVEVTDFRAGVRLLLTVPVTRVEDIWAALNRLAEADICSSESKESNAVRPVRLCVISTATGIIRQLSVTTVCSISQTGLLYKTALPLYAVSVVEMGTKMGYRSAATAIRAPGLTLVLPCVTFALSTMTMWLSSPFIAEPRVL